MTVDLGVTNIWGINGTLFLQPNAGGTIIPICYSDMDNDGSKIYINNKAMDGVTSYRIAYADVRDGAGAAVGTQLEKEVLEHIATERG